MDFKAFLTTTRPEQIIPESVSEQRKAYLYNDIRPFCKAGSEDLVAPAVNNNKKVKEN